MPAEKKLALFLPAGAIVLVMGIVAFFMAQYRQPVGMFDFSLPGASVVSLNNRTGVGNEKIYIVQGKNTTVRVDFSNILADAGKASRDTVKAKAEEWRKTQVLDTDPGTLTQIAYQPFDAGQIQGYYQLTETHISRGNTVQSRNLFFLKDGQPYQIIFSFVEPDTESDKTLVSRTWTTLLKQIGISPSALPVPAP